MARAPKNSGEVRDAERNIETEAAYAGSGPIGDGGEGSYSMPGVEMDNSVSMCQSAADSAKSFNAGEEENAGSGTSAVEDYD